jgi:hypothetical protein
VSACWSTRRSVSTWGHSASRAKQNSRKASKPLAWMRSMNKSTSVSPPSPPPPPPPPQSGRRAELLASACRSTSVMTPRLSRTPRRLVASSSRRRLALCRQRRSRTSGEPTSASWRCIAGAVGGSLATLGAVISIKEATGVPRRRLTGWAAARVLTAPERLPRSPRGAPFAVPRAPVRLPRRWEAATTTAAAAAAAVAVATLPIARPPRLQRDAISAAVLDAARPDHRARELEACARPRALAPEDAAPAGPLPMDEAAARGRGPAAGPTAGPGPARARARADQGRPRGGRGRWQDQPHRLVLDQRFPTRVRAHGLRQLQR